MKLKKEEVREKVFNRIADMIDDHYLEITKDMSEKELKIGVKAVNQVRDYLYRLAQTAGARSIEANDRQYQEVNGIEASV